MPQIHRFRTCETSTPAIKMLRNSIILLYRDNLKTDICSPSSGFNSVSRTSKPMKYKSHRHERRMSWSVTSAQTRIPFPKHVIADEASHRLGIFSGPGFGRTFEARWLCQRQTQSVNLMCDRQDDFDPELAATERTWNHTVLAVGFPIDSVSDQSAWPVSMRTMG